MQIDLLPKLLLSGGFGKIVTAMHVFFPLFFAGPTSNRDAKTIARVIFNIMPKHAYLPTTILPDKGSTFMSHVIKEVAGVFGITSNHATTKQAQRTGILEQSRASIKQTLEIETGERRSLWHTYVSFAVHIYNTFHHASIGCEPSRLFHGGIPFNVLHLKIVIRPQKITYANFANCLGCTSTDRDDLSRCPKECH